MSEDAKSEIIAVALVAFLFVISWGLARMSRRIGDRVWGRNSGHLSKRERKIADFSSTILFFTFLLLALMLAMWSVVEFANDGPGVLQKSLAAAGLIICGVVGFALEAGKRWAVGGVWFVCALMIIAFVYSMASTGIVRPLGVGLIVLYVAAIVASVSLARGTSSPTWKRTPQS